MPILQKSKIFVSFRWQIAIISLLSAVIIGFAILSKFGTHYREEKQIVGLINKVKSSQALMEKNLLLYLGEAQLNNENSFKSGKQQFENNFKELKRNVLLFPSKSSNDLIQEIEIISSNKIETLDKLDLYAFILESSTDEIQNILEGLDHHLNLSQQSSASKPQDFVVVSKIHNLCNQLKYEKNPDLISYNSLQLTLLLEELKNNHSNLEFLSDYILDLEQYVNTIIKIKPLLNEAEFELNDVLLEERIDQLLISYETQLEESIYLSDVLNFVVYPLAILLTALIVITLNRLFKQKQELQNYITHLNTIQDQLLNSEKMASLGQVIAGVAHEINTPIGIVYSESESIKTHMLPILEETSTYFQKSSRYEHDTLINLVSERIDTKKEILTTREERNLKKSIIKYLTEKNKENLIPYASDIVTTGLYKHLDQIIDDKLLYHKTDFIHLYCMIGNSLNSIKNLEFSIQKINKIIFSIKKFSRIDLEEVNADFNLIEGIEATLTLFQNHIKKGILLTREYEHKEIWIHGVENELQQIWTNLVSNAIHALGGSGVLKIVVHIIKDKVQINIIDTGKGISPEVIDRIFDPFFTTKPTGEGTGLGLDICKKIIQKHNGDINVTSVPGKLLLV